MSGFSAELGRGASVSLGVHRDGSAAFRGWPVWPGPSQTASLTGVEPCQGGLRGGDPVRVLPWSLRGGSHL